MSSVPTNLGTLFQLLGDKSPAEILAVGKTIQWKNHELVATKYEARHHSDAYSTVAILIREAPERVKQLLLPLALQETQSFNLIGLQPDEVINLPREAARAAVRCLDLDSLTAVLASVDSSQAQSLVADLLSDFGAIHPPNPQLQPTIVAMVDLLASYSSETDGSSMTSASPRERLFNALLTSQLTQAVGSSLRRAWAFHWVESCSSISSANLLVAVRHFSDLALLTAVAAKQPLFSQLFSEELNKVVNQKISSWFQGLSRFFSDQPPSIATAPDAKFNILVLQLDQFITWHLEHNLSARSRAGWCSGTDAEFISGLVSMLRFKPFDSLGGAWLANLQASNIPVSLQELTLAFANNQASWFTQRLAEACQQGQALNGLGQKLSMSFSSNEETRIHQIDLLASCWCSLLPQADPQCIGFNRLVSRATLTPGQESALRLKIKVHQQSSDASQLPIAKPLRL